MASFTNVGLTLLATSLQGLVTYVSVGTGCGTLAAGLTSGQTYTSLTLNAPLPLTLASGASLTLINTNNTDTQVVTVSSTTTGGATTIPVTSFTASASFAAGAGVVTTPSGTDTQLFNESLRVAALPGVAGANPGESLLSCYLDPSQPSATYLEFGYYGGSSATASLGTGTLIAREVQFWAHQQGQDSTGPQLDVTLSLT